MGGDQVGGDVCTGKTVLKGDGEREGILKKKI